MRYNYYDSDYHQRKREFQNDVSRLNLNEEALTREYDADDVWTASWAAYRLNGYEYIKSYSGNTDGKMLNRARIFSLLNKYEFITDEDREMGRAMREFNTRLTMVALTRELNSYEQMVAEVVLKDKIKGNPDISIVASLCNIFKRELERRKKAEVISELVEGAYVGDPGDRVTLNDVEVIQSKLSQTYLRYYNLGKHNGSLIGWWTDTGFELGSKINITARVKEHCSWNGDGVTAPMTKLNYVRVE